MVVLNTHWFELIRKQYFSTDSRRKYIIIYSRDDGAEEAVGEESGERHRYNNTVFRATRSSDGGGTHYLRKDFLSSDFQVVTWISEHRKRILFFYSRISISLERSMNEKEFEEECLSKQNWVTGQCVPKHEMDVWEINVDVHHRIRLENKRPYYGTGHGNAAGSSSYRLTVEHEIDDSREESNVSSNCCLQTLVSFFGEDLLTRITYESNASLENVYEIDYDIPTEMCKSHDMQLGSDSETWIARLSSAKDVSEFYILPKWNGIPAVGFWIRDTLFLYSQVFGFREFRVPHVFNVGIRIQTECFDTSAIVTEFIDVQNTTASSYEDLQEQLYAKNNGITRYIPITPALNIKLKQTVSSFTDCVCTFVVETVKLPTTNRPAISFVRRQLNRFRRWKEPLENTDGYIAVFCEQTLDDCRTVGLKLKRRPTVELELNTRDGSLQTLDGLDCRVFVPDNELSAILERFKWYNGPLHYPTHTVIVEMTVFPNSRLEYLKPRPDKCLPDSTIKLHTLFQEAKL